MKKILRKITAAMSAGMLCTMSLTNGFSASAAATQYKTYKIYSVAQDSSISYFDFSFQYSSDVTAEASQATSLCSAGYFRSTNNTTSRLVQDTYNGDPIGATGTLSTTKFIVPRNTTSIFDKVTYSNPVIRNENNITLSPSKITMEAVLMGDVNQDGAVNKADSELLNLYLLNSTSNPLTDTGKLAADVTEDGVLNSADSMLILNYCSGLVSNF